MRFIQTQGATVEYVNVETITTLKVVTAGETFVVQGNGTFEFGIYSTEEEANEALTALVNQVGTVATIPSDV